MSVVLFWCVWGKVTSELQDILDFKLLLCSECRQIGMKNSYLSAYEDGTDRVF